MILTVVRPVSGGDGDEEVVKGVGASRLQRRESGGTLVLSWMCLRVAIDGEGWGGAGAIRSSYTATVMRENQGSDSIITVWGHIRAVAANAAPARCRAVPLARRL